MKNVWEYVPERHGQRPDRLHDRGHADADARRLHDGRERWHDPAAAPRRRDHRRRRHPPRGPGEAGQAGRRARRPPPSSTRCSAVSSPTAPASRPQVSGYTVAGKTGTSRKPPYEPTPRYMASFAGFAPAESPRLAAIVVIDQPGTSNEEYFGGKVAAPLFSTIMQYALRLERVPPTGAVSAEAAEPEARRSRPRRAGRERRVPRRRPRRTTAPVAAGPGRYRCPARSVTERIPCACTTSSTPSTCSSSPGTRRSRSPTSCTTAAAPTRGALFCCIPGAVDDGHDHAPEAVAARRGRAPGRAAARASPSPQVRVARVRAALGPVAARFYGDPSRAMRVLGVTGTNGKTTTTYLLEAIAAAAGERVGVVGTTGARIDGVEEPLGFTTPEAPQLQAAARADARRGVGTVAMEVSSHALAYERVDGTRVRGGRASPTSRRTTSTSTGRSTSTSRPRPACSRRRSPTRRRSRSTTTGAPTLAASAARARDSTC